MIRAFADEVASRFVEENAIKKWLRAVFRFRKDGNRSRFRIWLAAVVVALTVACVPGLAGAVEVDEILADLALESRARALSLELRCLVCQNQSIDDSHAPLARDLRLIVRERLTAGDTDAEVIAFVVDRYGEFVLLRPRLGWHTALLWGAAPIALGLAGFLFWGRSRRTGPPSATPLSGEEERRLADILKRQEL
jgi:cytochrome c-type biogenesis protein CcmH